MGGEPETARRRHVGRGTSRGGGLCQLCAYPAGLPERSAAGSCLEASRACWHLHPQVQVERAPEPAAAAAAAQPAAKRSRVPRSHPVISQPAAGGDATMAGASAPTVRRARSGQRAAAGAGISRPMTRASAAAAAALGSEQAALGPSSTEQAVAAGVRTRRATRAAAAEGAVRLAQAEGEWGGGGCLTHSCVVLPGTPHGAPAAGLCLFPPPSPPHSNASSSTHRHH